MNLLDFENDFDCVLTFEGDNETDCNRIKIDRETFDGYGNEIQAGENIYLARMAIEDIAEGLEKMAYKFRQYLKT